MNSKQVTKESFRPCPFCDSKNITVIETSSHRYVAAACNDCGSQGPEIRKQTAGYGTPSSWWDAAESYAIEVWNKRTHDK